MGIFTWLMLRSFRKEAIRLAKEVTILYSVSKRCLPYAPESEVIMRMAFDKEGLASISQESRKRIETCCSTINGFCYMMTLDGGWGKGMMNFRSLQFTSYMDQELEIAGFPHQSVEQKRKILEEMDLAIDGWERWTGDDKVKILIVDDEPNIVQTLQDRFEMNDYEVITAGNGKEGLKKALKEKPDVIFLNVIMPIMDGHEMLEILRKQPDGDFSSVIMLTARSQKQDIARAYACGIDDYIICPFDLSDLMERLEVVIENRKAVAGKKATTMSFKRPTRETILVLSDESNIIQTFQDRLEMNGYKVITLGPEEFREDFYNVVKQLEQVDLVILSNYTLGPYVADEILQAIYDNYPEMPIVFTPTQTVKGLSIFKKCAMVMDIRYMEKPYDLSELLEEIEEIFRVPV